MPSGIKYRYLSVLEKPQFYKNCRIFFFSILVKISKKQQLDFIFKKKISISVKKNLKCRLQS